MTVPGKLGNRPIGNQNFPVTVMSQKKLTLRSLNVNKPFSVHDRTYHVSPSGIFTWTNFPPTVLIYYCIRVYIVNIYLFLS